MIFFGLEGSSFVIRVINFHVLYIVSMFWVLNFKICAVLHVSISLVLVYHLILFETICAIEKQGLGLNWSDFVTWIYKGLKSESGLDQLSFWDSFGVECIQCVMNVVRGWRIRAVVVIVRFAPAPFVQPARRKKFLQNWMVKMTIFSAVSFALRIVGKSLPHRMLWAFMKHH